MDFMRKYQALLAEVKIENAENEIRAKHNELESKRLFGRKNYFPYSSKKFIALIKFTRDHV